MAAIQNIMKTKYYFYLNINFYYGKDIINGDDGRFVGWKEYSKLMSENSNCADIGFISHKREHYPKLCRFFKEAGISSTIQCAIMDGEQIKGAVTFNKCKTEEAQWANYEVDCASILASYIGMICVNGSSDVLKNAGYNMVSVGNN